MVVTDPSQTAAGRLPRRRLVQATFLVLALIPTTSSVLTLTIGVDRFVDSATLDPALDNTYRYLGGVYLALALLALWSIPRIEDRIDHLTFVGGAIALGGVGRLISVADVGAPSNLTWYVLVIEFGAALFAIAVRRTVQRLNGRRGLGQQSPVGGRALSGPATKRAPEGAVARIAERE